MKIFLTGANGMLGSSITRALLQKNYKVKCMVMPTAQNNNLDGLDVEIVLGNLLDKEWLRKEIAGCDAIINVAASTQIYPRRAEIIWKVNFEGVKNLVEIAQESNVQRFIQIGTANSFPEGSKSNPGTEEGKFNANRFGMDYIDSKYAAQEYLLQLHETEKFPAIIVNPTYMIGPFDSGPTSGKMLQAFAKGKLPGYTNGGKSFVCAKDVAAAVANAVTMGRTGQCYIAAGENLTYAEFMQKAATVLNRPFQLKAIPGALVICLGFFSSALARITRKPPQLSYGMAKISGVGQYYSNKKIVSELAMPQTPIEQGIRECLDWFRENNYI